MNGIINVYKEADYTSFDVVAKLRGILKTKKIGHTGTLDPQATGVLPICIGKATKLVESMTDHDKTYRVAFRLGLDTDTQDIWGQVLQRQEVPTSIDAAMVENLLMTFLGSYDQVPPMYSALKVDGKRLYELARKGIEVKREARQVRIHAISDFRHVKDQDYECLVSCSRGTYIRTLIYDLGIKLGVGAVMIGLERTIVGQFTKETAWTIEEIQTKKETNQLNSCMISIEDFLKQCNYPIVKTRSEEDRFVHNGNKLIDQPLKRYGLTEKVPDKVLVYDSTDVFIGIYHYDSVNDNLRVDKIFYE